MNPSPHGIIASIWLLVFCGDTALSVDLYWCPVCGGNTHHPGGHPHFSPGGAPPPPPPLPQDSPNVREAKRLYQESRGIILNQLNQRTYTNAREEYQLLIEVREKLRRVRRLYPQHPHAEDVLDQINIGLEDWQRRARKQELLRKLGEAQKIQSGLAEQLQAIASKADAQAMRTQLEQLKQAAASTPTDTHRVPIGAAGGVDGEVWAKAPGAGDYRPISSGSTIYHDDRIVTGANGKIQVLLTDETVFTIGPDADMMIDLFVYNPFDSSGQILAQVTKGTFRFVSGRIARKKPSGMKVKLPTGTIGIRGTDYLVTIANNGASSIAVLEGEILFTSNQGEEAAVTAGAIVDISPSGSPGRVVGIESSLRSPIANLCIALISADGLNPLQKLIKFAFLGLGVASLFGWVWSGELRSGKSMALSCGIGVMLITLSYLITAFFSVP